MSQIICENLSLGYDGRVVSQGIDFEVDPGDFLCVVGENGAGKSTLVRTLLGLTPPLCGHVRFEGGLRRSEIGYLPQQTALQRDFPASVWEVVLSGCLNRCGLRPFYNRKERALAERNLSEMDMLAHKKCCYRELSGGQQQRVLLARALCATRKLLLLDEPVSGLDPKAAAEMYALIRRLNREAGISILMISHDVLAATREASYVLHLSHTPRFFGTTEAYRQSEVGRRFLGAAEGEGAGA